MTRQMEARSEAHRNLEGLFIDNWQVLLYSVNEILFLLEGGLLPHNREKTG